MAVASPISALREGVRAALAVLPMAVRDRLADALDGGDRRTLESVGAALATGRRGRGDYVPGGDVLADTLNQVSINAHGKFGQADSRTIADLRGIAEGLQPGRGPRTRAFAVGQLREMLYDRHRSGALAQAMQEVEHVKLANIDELARVLENEAGSPTDQPIMEAVGHTVLNRMRRNQTAVVTDVSGRYSRGKTPASPDTRQIAIDLLNGALPDITGGATHFYQPNQMAHETALTDAQRRVIGQYRRDQEYVPGVTVRVHGRDVPAINQRPDWAANMRQVPVGGIPDWLAKFFIAPGSGHVR